MRAHPERSPVTVALRKTGARSFPSVDSISVSAASGAGHRREGEQCALASANAQR